MITLVEFLADSLKNPWVLFGLFAQSIFFLRFILQWIVSEKAGRVVIPVTFWYLSMVGAIMIFVYSVYRKDIVFITASFLSLFIYSRNIFLHLHSSSFVEDKNEKSLVEV